MKANPKENTSQHKFCFICAGKLRWKGKNLLLCSNCGYHKYINPTPCNGAILQNGKGEILLVERKVEPKKGYWDLPGGFVDLNENAEKSMHRELEEELGIKPKNLKYFTSKYDVYKYDGIELPTLGLIFTGLIGSEKLIVTSDVAGFKFFPKDKIPWDKIAFDGLREGLQEFTAAY